MDVSDYYPGNRHFMLINGIHTRNGIANSASATLNKRQHSVSRIQPVAPGHGSPSNSSLKNNTIQHPQKTVQQPHALTEPSSIHTSFDTIYREQLHPRAQKAVHAYQQQEMTDRKAEISRLMGIDIYV